MGYKSEWETEFPWLIPEKNSMGEVKGMLCCYCKMHKTVNKYNKSTVWSVTPWVCLRKDSVRRHSQSLQHKEAVTKELDRERSSQDGDIQQAFQRQLSLNKAVLKTAMQCLYWLVKEEIPHILNYFFMLKAVEIMDCSQLKHLQHGDNAKYTSRRVTHEFLQVMSNMIEQAQLRDLLASPVYSLLIGETTDVAIIKEMVIYQFRYSSSNCLSKDR